MSDAYQIEGVTITPQGGGFYLLTHPSLPEPIKERGKEAAETRAHAVALAAAEDDGSQMAPQGAIPPLAANADPAATGGPDVTALQAQLAASEAARVAAEQARAAAEAKLAAGVKTVVVEPGVSAQIPAGVPRHFTEETSEEARKALEKLGVKTTKIVLEENESIPPTGLFLGHNGRGYMIQPGVEVVVPNFLLGVLNDAVMSAPVVDAKSQKVLGYRNRMKYPYRKIES